ncbi:MAG: threonylcarbamoyl-AMP synthase [Acidobacteria bacterium]|nr:threonylcarbamoyl-AMP synthase [Acidobacteriota bacterium]
MAEIIEVNPERPEPEIIRLAATLIRAGEVVAIPTDTVYGLATDAFNGAAAEKVFALKGRPAAAPLLVLVSSMEMALACADSLTPQFLRLAARFWPGPLTIVVPAFWRIPREVTAGYGTVGIRLPKSAIAIALIDALGGPITASSANLSGQPECLTAQAVESSIGAGLKLVLDGGASAERCPSTVISLIGDEMKLLREGAVSIKAISDFLHAQ